MRNSWKIKIHGVFQFIFSTPFHNTFIECKSIKYLSVYIVKLHNAIYKLNISYFVLNRIRAQNVAHIFIQTAYFSDIIARIRVTNIKRTSKNPLI